MSRAVGLGAGGHAKVVLDVLRHQTSLQIVGLLDPDPALHGTLVLGMPVLGGDDRLPELLAGGLTHFFVGVGGIGSNDLRIRLFRRGLELGLLPVLAIHPTATIAPSAELGPGTTVMAASVINPCVRLGTNVVVNTGAIIEHDCEIGDHAHIAPGACLLGGVRIGAAAHVGARAVVRQGLSVGDGAIVAAGAVVIRDVPPGVTVLGVPAHPRIVPPPSGARGIP